MACRESSRFLLKSVHSMNEQFLALQKFGQKRDRCWMVQWRGCWRRRFPLAQSAFFPSGFSVASR